MPEVTLTSINETLQSLKKDVDARFDGIDSQFRGVAAQFEEMHKRFEHDEAFLRTIRDGQALVAEDVKEIKRRVTNTEHRVEDVRDQLAELIGLEEKDAAATVARRVCAPAAFVPSKRGN